MSRPAIATVPVGLRVEGRLVVVVGGGPVAARKATAYANQGARLRVVAIDLGPEMVALNADEVHQRAFAASDLDDAWWVVTATGNPEIDGAVFAEAERRQLWCNAADDPQHCSAILPAVVRRGDLTVAISTGGRSPALATWLRRQLDDLLDPITLAMLDIAAEVRDECRQAGRPTEVSGWQEALDAGRALVADGHGDQLADNLRAVVEAGVRP